MDPRNLYLSDVKELGLRIQRAVEGGGSTSQAPFVKGAEATPWMPSATGGPLPSSSDVSGTREAYSGKNDSNGSDATSYPPDEVLYLLRLTVMIIQTVEAPAMLGASKRPIASRK